MRLLTNEGMLKILCLEVEEHLKSICSSCLSDDLKATKGEKHVRDQA
jgi:hypothetical protein